ncbi:MAG: crossover junction endodeoxyribonuclease RuvC [Blastocatellia bacterium]|nr:crossover junction endodeoxyribonuclease RuvC [Blastocatellia bacterium]
MKVRVLGVDPGSESTGFGIIDSDGQRHQPVEYGAIRAPRGGAFPDRLLYIETRLQRLIDTFRPDVVAVEEAFYAVNVKSALKLGHVRGVVLLVAARAGLPIFEYSPLEVKSATVGYGRAEKHQVQQMVRILLNLPAVPEPHDAADALAIAICHIHHHGHRHWRISAEAHREL